MMTVSHSAPLHSFSNSLISVALKVPRSTLRFSGKSTASAGLVAITPCRRARFNAVRRIFASKFTVVEESPCCNRCCTKAAQIYFCKMVGRQTEGWVRHSMLR